ncbi:Xaa-Pro aminopeptidase [bacterium (Candidatus Blackallbacteria) CG17_big_fil_post_rev_8_21_14_2_50_48_46]|uniref:Xaa-Pro aminopeptidase n=1 Tax=bacterium (Candidatus Blackallbacteria) CG17_big_fil_post_rev_8_21_14_2_50_48_46 TaxID=2014261 RepID=A0A2M7G0X6_9BACT|nr:MAG: Xaa-Pro aminopeptidase [bacterium (Candidatus Blackallbacteria) CG18_big_fil_WC_8_21_14_2_50_49_26]PIW15339.1 MAG: Xaa-Pro aminopeptidase [bacterium (Candidatus Blackallbacteria) CG17_big_fil_post_rev_8_21_14_2_50_48_46]PIW49800.1 MAG: Xaa-Pro aminopeptidase [bacterium (Candidatus Blackallbacteria) CG13_big_fil_rev_8_21_14_2_50_49_14]
MLNLEFHSENRKRLLAQLPPKSVVIINSAPQATYSHDVHYPYRQNSYLRYLTGFTEHDAVLVLAPDSPTPYTMFVLPRDLEKEIWNGFRQGVDGIRQVYGAQAAYTIDQLDSKLPELMANTEHLYYALGHDENFDKTVLQALNAVRKQIRNGVSAPRHVHDPGEILNEMRLHKQPIEIEWMQKAADIAVEAHTQVMKTVKPEMYEYEVQALIDYTFGKQQSRAGYPSIVGGGLNATILHYIENNQKLCDGEMLLVDAGAEYRYYNSDITRTFPINGKFSPVQRKVYELVLKAQKAAIEMVKPGNTFMDPHTTAVRHLTEGLVELGLLEGDPEQLIAQESYKKFYMHKTGHWLGGDVHDVGDYKDADGNWRKLEPGMVLTVEPGLYFGPHLAGEIPHEFLHIGIRIEDDILVTEDGHRNLTAGVVKEVDQIEALMQD